MKQDESNNSRNGMECLDWLTSKAFTLLVGKNSNKIISVKYSKHGMETANHVSEGVTYRTQNFTKHYSF